MSKIKEFRLSRNLTQEELGRLVGVKRATVALWENGVNHPRVDTLRKLAKVFRCRVDDLLCA